MCRENQNTKFMSKSFFRKPWRLWENIGKHGSGSQATVDNKSGAENMRFACRISKERIQTTFIIFNNSCFVIGLIPSDVLTFYGNAYKNWENAQRHVCHSDLLSEIVRLRESSFRHFTCRLVMCFYCRRTGISTERPQFIQRSSGKGSYGEEGC